MDDMDNRPGPNEGSNEHPASAGGSGVGGHDASATPVSGDGVHDEPWYDAHDEPRLAALLDRSAQVLQRGPDELTAHRHLAAMRKEAATAAATRPRILRAASISAAAAVALVVTLAGFGALPAPAQQVLSDVADRVGITIPSPADQASSGEVPAKQQPAPETVPGRPGGPDRAELRGLTEDGTLQTPGVSDGHTPPGHSGSDQSPSQDQDVPGAPDVPETPREPPAPDPPGQAEQPPAPPEQRSDPVEAPPDRTGAPPSGLDPPDATPPPEPPDAEDPPGSDRSSGASGEGSSPGDQGGGRSVGDRR